MLLDLIRANRSYRRFYEEVLIDRPVLESLINLARLSPSGANRQALKYYLAYDGATNGKVFATLGWAGYLPEWPGPAAGERPSAYIVIVQEIAYKQAVGIDHGIAAQSILLGAAELGLGGCMLGNVRRPELCQALGIPETEEVLLVIALGKPKETVVVDEIDPGEAIKYWRDENQVHHVPKRKLKDVIKN